MSDGGLTADIRARQPGNEPNGGGACETGWASGTGDSLPDDSMKLCHSCHESVGGQSSSSESMMEITFWLWTLFHGSLAVNGSTDEDGLGLDVSTLVDGRVVAVAAQSGGKRGESQTDGAVPSGTVGVRGVVETRYAQLGR